MCVALLLTATLFLSPGLPTAPQSPAAVKRIAELLPVVRRDLRALNVAELNAADRRRYEYAKYLLAEVGRIAREDATREMDALALLELAAAEAASLVRTQLHIDEYVALVSAYRRGDTTAAVRLNDDWPASRLTRFVEYVAESTAQLGRKGSALEPFDTKTVLGAVVLHTDIAFRAPESGSHLALARRWLAWFSDGDPPGRFRQSWYLAVAGHLQGEGQLLEALRHDDEAVERFPDDSRLLVAAGALNELLASPQIASLAPRRKRVSLNTTPIVDREVSIVEERKRKGLATAEKLYRAALTVDPGCQEAHLRLGRVLFLSGRRDAALGELVVAAQAADVRVRYLADMFVGAVHEADRRWEDAIGAYRRADARHAGCLARGVALSHALRRSGDQEASSQAMAAVLRIDRESPCQDPWWDYPLGAFRERDRLLSELREAVR